MNIKIIGNGRFGYEEYNIGIDSKGLCYIKFAHCEWELAGY